MKDLRQLPPYPHPTDALSYQLPPYPHPTDALSCQSLPYPANVSPLKKWLNKIDNDLVSFHQPSERDQVAFSSPLICTGARWNPATCGTHQGRVKQRFEATLRRDRLGWHPASGAALSCPPAPNSPLQRAEG